MSTDSEFASCPKCGVEVNREALNCLCCGGSWFASQATIDAVSALHTASSNEDGFVPSEEMILYCDVPGCQSQLSMVAGVPREDHGWGRATIHTPLSSDWAFGQDYDLCSLHYGQVKALLEGTSHVL